MTKVTIGKWGKSAALRLPSDVLRAADLKVGDQVEVETRDRKIVVGIPNEHLRKKAAVAAARIIKRSKGQSLGGLSIRDLINEGRKY